MNMDARRTELMEKANNLIDTISENMRTVENVESAKAKFLNPESALSLELPTSDPDFSDVFKLAEIFDEKGTDKIKAYILTELELLEEDALRLLEAAGFKDVMRAAEPVEEKKAPEEDWEDVEIEDPEEDSDMKIVIPKSMEKGHHSRKPLPDEKVQQINKLVSEGMKPKDIAEKAGVSYNSAVRYANKYMDSIPNGAAKGSGRSASRR